MYTNEIIKGRKGFVKSRLQELLKYRALPMLNTAHNVQRSKKLNLSLLFSTQHILHPFKL